MILVTTGQRSHSIVSPPHPDITLSRPARLSLFKAWNRLQETCQRRLPRSLCQTHRCQRRSDPGQTERKAGTAHAPLGNLAMAASRLATLTSTLESEPIALANFSADRAAEPTLAASALAAW